MKKSKKEEKFQGLRVITEETLLQQKKEADKSLELPMSLATHTKKPAVVMLQPVLTPSHLTPDYCKGGDLDRCPAPCGACLQKPNAGALSALKIEYGLTLNMEVIATC